MDRRLFFHVSTAAIFLTLAKGAEAHKSPPAKRNHPHPHVGVSNGCIPVAGEHSFRRGGLNKMFEMPACVFIIQHAGHEPHPEFDHIAMSDEVLPLWVRDDAPIKEVEVDQILNFAAGNELLFSTHTGKSRIIRHSHALNERVLRRVLQNSGWTLRHLPGQVARGGYETMRSAALADRNVVLMGYRGNTFSGLRPLRVNGLHPYHDYDDYPLRKELHLYTRRTSVIGARKRDLYLSKYADRTAEDHRFWAELEGAS